MANQRLNEIHNLRAFIITLIVTIHTLSTLFLLEQSAWPLHLVWGISSDASSAFVFIAGYLFQHLSTKFTYSRYLYKKWFNVILPYLIVTLPFILKRLYEGDTLFQDYPLYQKIILYYLTGGHVMYLWFMPMIFLFFFAAPILIRLDKNPAFYSPVLLVLLFFALTINRALLDPFSCFVHYAVFYVFGMFASHYREAFITACQRWIGLIFIGATLLIASHIVVHFYPHLLTAWLLTPPWIYINILPLFFIFSTLKWLFIIPLIWWLFYRFDTVIQNKPALLADMSFGVYFVHGYALAIIFTVLRRFNPDMPHLPNNILFVLLMVGVVLAMCAIGLALVKWLFGKYSRMLTGY